MKPVLLNYGHLILYENTMALLLLLCSEGDVLEVACRTTKVLIHRNGKVLLLRLIILIAQLLKLIFRELVAECHW